MSLPAEVTRYQYEGSGAQTVFIYRCYLPSAESLTVYLWNGQPTTLPVLQLLTTNYTVQDVGSAEGGTITMVTAPPSGYILTLWRNVPAEYNFNFSSAQTITGQDLDDAFVETVLVEQQNSTNYIQTCIKYSPTDFITQQESPTQVDQTIVPILGENEAWIGLESGNIGKVTISDDPGASLLRTQLASEVSGSDGARLVGFYNNKTNSGTTVDAVLTEILSESSGYVIPTESGTPEFNRPYLCIGAIEYDGISMLGAKNIVLIPQFPKAQAETNIQPILLNLMTKDLSLAWAPGYGEGGNLGALALSFNVAVYLVYYTNPTTGIITADIGAATVDGEFAALPPNYTRGPRIGYFFSGFASIQIDNEIAFTGQSPVNGTTAVAVTSLVPDSNVIGATVNLNSGDRKPASFAAAIQLECSVTLSSCSAVGALAFDIYPTTQGILPPLNRGYYFGYLAAFSSGQTPAAPTITASKKLTTVFHELQTIGVYVSAPSTNPGNITITGSFNYYISRIYLNKDYNQI